MPDERPDTCAIEGKAKPADFDPWHESGWLHARNTKKGEPRHLSDGTPVIASPLEDRR